MLNRNNRWLIIRSRIRQGIRSKAVLLASLGLVLLFVGAVLLLLPSQNKMVPQLVGAASPLSSESTPTWQQVLNPVEQTSLFPPNFFSTLPSQPVLESTAEDGQKLTVYTTLDEKLQFKLIKLLRRYHPQLGAGILLDLESGAVLAMADYRNESENGSILPLDCGNLCLVSAFPAASLFKIVTAYGVLDKQSVSRKTNYQVIGRHHTLYKYQLGIGKSRYRYRPSEISFEKAFARSVNPVFGKFGIDYFSADELVGLAESFSFNRTLRFDQPVLESQIELPQTPFQQAETSSGFIKTTTISPLHAALLVGAPLVVNRLQQPYIVNRITSKTGAELYYHQPQKCDFQLRDKKACSELVAMMRATVKYGTARKSFRDVNRRRSFRKLKVGGKTGSLDMPDNSHRCEWFAGFGENPATGKMVAVAVVLVHGEKRTISSGYIASEMIAASLKK
ncbi:MAG: hypothetical protein KAG92_06665 [Deltaproteobacteria bacterium]|nr:hypothetical protein [Deltaproteobacteria bacterium]